MAKVKLLLVVITGVVLICFSPPEKGQAENVSGKIERVAHGGGAFKQLSVTNSLNALDINKDHYNFFEIDLNFTSDGALVCIHDWEGAATNTLGRSFVAPPTLEEFEDLTRNNPKFKNCTLETLAKWLEENPNKIIVTDIKNENIRGLKIISDRYPKLRERFIPQIYHPSEYYPVRKMGYPRVIFTLYIFGGQDQDVLNAAKRYDFFAITMPPYRVPGLAQALKRAQTPTYVHTINSLQEAKHFKESGITEIYTDVLWDKKADG